MACTVNVASNSITLTHSGLDTDDKVIIIVVSHILLPNSTKPTAAFTIRSFSASFYIDEVIDLTFAPKPGTLLNTSVTRAAPRIREST